MLDGHLKHTRDRVIATCGYIYVLAYALRFLRFCFKYVQCLFNIHLFVNHIFPVTVELYAVNLDQNCLLYL